MDSKISIKYEPDEAKYDGIIKKEPYQSEGSFDIKPEPIETDCSYDLDLYLDHQIKEEIVIGPTEFLKQDTGSLSYKTVYPCTICNKTFKYKIALNKHNSTAHNNNTVVSYFFHQEKNNKPNNKHTRKVNKHLKNVNNDFDDEKFDANTNLDERVDNSKNKCPFCVKTFTATKNLTRHIKDFHTSNSERKRYPCDKCDMTFNRTDYLSRHKLIHSESHKLTHTSRKNKTIKNDKNDFESITCGVCFKHFATLQYLQNHMKRCPMLKDKSSKVNGSISGVTTNEKKMIKENIGIKKEKVDDDMKIQENNFSNLEKEEKYDDNTNLDEKVDNSKNKCPFCVKTFTFSNNLTRHIKTFHTPHSERKIYSCDKCNRTFNRKDYLTSHNKLTKNHSEGRIICKCGRKCYNKQSLKRHQEYYCVLNPSKPEKHLFCDICNKGFSNKSFLSDHLRRHAREKNLICDFCKKIFPEKYLLIRHIQHHMKVPEVMYECEICGKKFIRSWSLKKHLISHSDKKPFTCKFCGRGFRSSWGCLSHEKRVCRVPT